MLIRRLYWTAYLAFASRGQGRYAFKPLEAIRRDQARRVRRMVAYAYRHVPYYRETMDRLGRSPADFRSADDLARLPIVDRQEVQRNPERFDSRGIRLDRCLRLRTSGSTATPITCYRGRRSVVLSAAHVERAHSIIKAVVGLGARYRHTLIGNPGGAGSKTIDFCQAITLAPSGVRERQQRLSALEPPEVNVPLLNEFKPHVLFAYGSYLELLFAYVDSSGCPFHRPRLVIYGGDGLTALGRRRIAEDFQTPVFSMYQAVEAHRMAFECEEHRGLHINIDLYPLRVVDGEGRARPPGEPGDVIVSNLVNRGTVLLNYRLGDVAALLPEPCPCGRTLPLMSFPHGRCEDFVVLPSGQKLTPFAGEAVLKDFKAILQFQLVQEEAAQLKVLLVVDRTCDRQELAQRVRDGFAPVLGDEVTVDVCFVDAIERTASGKRRAVVSRLHQAQRSPAGLAPGAT